MVNESRESDGLIVSGKLSNKICDNKRMAEKVERRRPAKGNPVEQNKGRTQSRETLQRELDRIWQKAAKDMIIHQGVYALLPEAGAQCANSARWDLCGGCRVTGIPTANIDFGDTNFL